jgi:K+-sensing histidine kinase KdpD
MFCAGALHAKLSRHVRSQDREQSLRECSSVSLLYGDELLELPSLCGRRACKEASRPIENDMRTAPPLGEEPLPRDVFEARALPLLLSCAGIGLVTAALLPLGQSFAANLVPIAYLIPVIFAATRWGIWPALVASIAGIAAADFFFFPPLYSFHVDDPQEVIDILLFLVVSLVSSNLASRLRRETKTLRERESEIQHLYEFSRRLAACFTVSDLIAAIEEHLKRTLGPHASFFVAMPDGHFEPPESKSAPKAVRENATSMVRSVGISARTIVDPPTREAWLVRAILSQTALQGVIAINIGHGSRDTIEIKIGRVEAILEEVSLTLQRLDIGKAMEDARIHLQAQLLREAFHGTLSHELCSPLAAIKGSVSVLESMPIIRAEDRARTLVEAISEETAQLNGFIRSLLNATRVTAGGVTPHLEWADPEDVINAAITRRARRLSAHHLQMNFAIDLPLIHVDSGLVEEACGQLLENAAKYSPSRSTISVNLAAEGGHVTLSISDQGVGITPDEQRYLGRRSFRSTRHQASIPGSGLGFWIASTFVQANGGTIAVLSQGHGRGTTVTVSFPASHPVPSVQAALSNDQTRSK